MSAYPNLMFLDTNTSIVAQSLESIVDVMLQAGFRIVQTSIGDSAYEWSPQSITSIIENADRSKQLTLRYENPDLRFELSQEINWNSQDLGADNRIWFQTYTFNTAYFWNSVEESEEYSKLLLSLGVDLYNILHPTFGWIDFNFGMFTTHEDVESISLPTLYWANFLGPQYVARLGSRRIQSAPYWRLDQLLDGGYLYVLSSGLGLSRNSIDLELVKQVFGTERVR